MLKSIENYSREEFKYTRLKNIEKYSTEQFKQRV